MSNGVAPLGDIDFRAVSGPGNIKNANVGVGTGVNLASDKIFWVNPNDIINLLAQIDYDPYIDIYRDCDNRAMFGWAHLRHKFPGVPSGMISGKNDLGQDHAEIMFWVEGSKEPILFDPNRKGDGPVGKYQSVMSAIAFPPFPLGSESNSTPPFTNLTVKSNLGFFYNQSYHVYPKQAIINYLANKEFDQPCNKADHVVLYPSQFESGGNWASYDEALWAVVHLRLQFIGCAVGVARGTKIDGKLPSTIIIWYYPNDNKANKPAYCYWDIEAKKEVQFNPGMIIY